MSGDAQHHVNIGMSTVLVSSETDGSDNENENDSRNWVCDKHSCWCVFIIAIAVGVCLLYKYAVLDKVET